MFSAPKTNIEKAEQAALRVKKYGRIEETAHKISHALSPLENAVYPIVATVGVLAGYASIPLAVTVAAASIPAACYIFAYGCLIGLAGAALYAVPVLGAIASKAVSMTAKHLRKSAELKSLSHYEIAGKSKIREALQAKIQASRWRRFNLS